MNKKRLELARCYHFTAEGRDEIANRHNVAPSAVTAASQAYPAQYFLQNNIPGREPIDYGDETIKDLGRRILCTETDQEFKNAKEAAEELKITRQSIYRVIRDKRIIKGRRFVYMD